MKIKLDWSVLSGEQEWELRDTNNSVLSLMRDNLELYRHGMLQAQKTGLDDEKRKYESIYSDLLKLYKAYKKTIEQVL